MRALRTSRLVRICVERARCPVVEVTAHDDAQRVRSMDLRVTGDGRTRTRWHLVVRRNATGDVQAIACLNRVFLPPSPHLLPIGAAVSGKGCQIESLHDGTSLVTDSPQPLTKHGQFRVSYGYALPGRAPAVGGTGCGFCLYSAHEEASALTSFQALR